MFTSALALAAVSRAGPTTRPRSPDDDKHQTQAASASQAAGLPFISIHSLAEVTRLSVQDDMLAAQLLLKDTPPLECLDLPHPGLIATLQTLPPIRREVGVLHGFTISLRDFSPPGSMVVFTTLSSIDGRLMLSRDYESSTVLGSTQLIQDAPPMPGELTPNVDPVRLFISRTDAVTLQNELKITLSAKTFAALCRAHPTQTQDYLRPIFHDLGEEAAVFAPNPAAVWQALADDWKPDEGLIPRVEAAIARFDSDDFQVRQSAAHSLHQLGEPAALALMRMDRTKLSAAQRSGVETFLAPYLPLSPDEANRLGKNRNFLLDSQYCEDPALRSLAAARLAKMTGQPIGFDPAADEQTRLTQIDHIRQSGPTTSP
jgi:hypothetical protein